MEDRPGGWSHTRGMRRDVQEKKVKRDVKGKRKRMGRNWGFRRCGNGARRESSRVGVKCMLSVSSCVGLAGIAVGMRRRQS
jgi:hypothetical protein